ncbi:MAG TPA: NAD-binding oxidoreductase [Archangium sp.]|jgi:NAD(P)H-flavin reductase|uniref:NAD-binding oxidoreductase n=1 Tax=Archangium sp. TaxID=1872627 RepID=UPI002ED9CE7F
MTDWHPTTVAAVLPATEDLTELILDIGGTPLVGTHRTPGQYVRLALPEVGESPFAIASPPEPFGTRWEFLLKGGSALADTLMRLQPGAQVHSKRPEGRGFPLVQARGGNLLLFATGSGISPIRSVIESVRAERSAYGRVMLYFGARTPQAFAYEDELHHWESAGIRVVRTVSQPGASGWQGLTGYVQAHLGEVQVEDTLAFVCGQSGMVQEVIDALRARGLPREAIHLNY